MTRRRLMQTAAVIIGIGSAGMLFRALTLAADTNPLALLAGVATVGLGLFAGLLWREA